MGDRPAWCAGALVCAGGRYDGLVEQLGGRPVPAVGFAMGLERLVAVLEEVNPDAATKVSDIYLVLVGDAAAREGLLLAEQLRDAFPQLEIVCNCGGGSLKAQFKRADHRSGASLPWCWVTVRSRTERWRSSRCARTIEVMVARESVIRTLKERFAG